MIRISKNLMNDCQNNLAVGNWKEFCCTVLHSDFSINTLIKGILMNQWEDEGRTVDKRNFSDLNFKLFTDFRAMIQAYCEPSQFYCCTTMPRFCILFIWRFKVFWIAAKFQMISDNKYHYFLMLKSYGDPAETKYFL